MHFRGSAPPLGDRRPPAFDSAKDVPPIRIRMTARLALTLFGIVCVSCFCLYVYYAAVMWTLYGRLPFLLRPGRQPDSPLQHRGLWTAPKFMYNATNFLPPRPWSLETIELDEFLLRVFGNDTKSLQTTRRALVEGAELKLDNWLADLRVLMADRVEWQEMLTAPLRAKIASYLETEGETIFFAIPAFRDLWCSRTLETIFLNAKRPENVRVGLFLQMDMEQEREGCVLRPELRKWEGNIRRISTRWQDVRGLCWARHMVTSLYAGETYFFQLDAHSLMVPGWDDAIIRMYKGLGPGKTVLSTHPESYKKFEEQSKHPNGTYLLPLLCGYANDNGWPRPFGILADPETEIDVTRPVSIPFVGGGYIFARGELIREVPFDPHLPFCWSSEELLHAIRIWTSGWEIYGPTRNLVFHNYERNNVPGTFMDTENDFFQPLEYAKQDFVELTSKRVLAVLSQQDPANPPSLNLPPAEHASLFHNIGKYGIGRERPFSEYLRRLNVVWNVHAAIGGAKPAPGALEDRSYWLCSQKDADGRIKGFVPDTGGQRLFNLMSSNASAQFQDWDGVA